MKHIRRIPLMAAGILLAATMAQAQNQPAAEAEQPPAPPLPILRLDAEGPVSRITSLAFSPDGKTLYAAGLDKAVYAWTMNDQGKFQFAPAKALRIPIGPDLSGTINAMSISSDGRYLAVGGKAVGSRLTGFREGGLVFPAATQSVKDRLETGTIYVFDLQNPGQPQVTHLRGHLGTVLLLAFAPAKGNQSPVLVSAGEEYDPAIGDQRGAVRVWDLRNPKESVAENFDLVAPSALKDGKGNQLNPPRAIAALRTGNDPKSLQVGIAWGEHVLRVWDVAKNQIVALDNISTVACAGVDNTFLLAGGYRRGTDGQAGWHLGLWKPPVTKTTQPVKTERSLTGQNAPLGLAKAANANTALVVALEPPRKIGFFLADSQTLQRMPSNAADVPFGDLSQRPAFAIHPKGELVAVAGNLDRKIQVFRVNPNQAPVQAQVLEGQGDLLPLVRFYRKGQALGLGLDREINPGNNQNNAPDLIFDLTEGEAVADPAGWNPAPANAGITAQAGQQADRKTVVIDLGGGKTTTIILPKDQTFVESQIALCPKTENHPPLVGLIVQSPTFAESILRVYNAETGDRLRQFSGHTDTITSIAFSDDGKLLASAGEDRTVRVWWMEDLKSHIGQHGFLDRLILTDKNNVATVKEIDEFAAADIKQNLKLDDVIEGFTGPDGKFVTTAKSAAFFYYLSMVPPLSEADGSANSVKLQIRRDGQRLANTPEVQVQQGVDERKPLFTLFFKASQPARAWSWIGWTPIGPFDSSDPEIETLVGWHINPPNPDAPSSYAALAEYRKDHHTKGLFKSLIETGNLPPKEDETANIPQVEDLPVVLPDPKDFRTPPRPKVELSLFIHQTQGAEQALETVTLEPDAEQRVWAETKNLKAIFSVTGISSTELQDKLTWLLDGEKQPFPVKEPIAGLFEADLSRFDWQPKANKGSYTLRVSYADDSLSQEHFIEQAIVFAPPPPPPPPPEKKLPRPSIVTPDFLTVLYDQLHERQTDIVVELTAVDDAPVQPGRLTFERNGQPLEKDGQPWVHEFDETTAQIKDTLPLVNGENSIRVRLESKEGPQKILSDRVVVYYRRPPRVKLVQAKADVQQPRAEILCELETPEDLPPVGFQIFINNKEFTVHDDQITKAQDETDKTLWKVTAKDVLLSEGQNTIRFLPRNADGRALNAPKTEQPWEKPPAPPKPLPSRPKVYFSNVNNQVPLANHWQGDEFTVAFNVLASAKLQKVLVFYNGERLKPPEIPQPKDDVKYEFQLPVKLARQQNELRVIAMDENFRWTETPVTLAPLKPPVTLVIDELEVPAQNARLKPQSTEEQVLRFNEPAGHGRVVLRGRVLTTDTTTRFERPWVKCWVNGFLQWARANPNPDKPMEWTFAMNLTLNQKTENRLYLELPEAPQSPFSQRRCFVDCTHPETRQNLRMVLVGIDPADLRGVDAAQLENQARQAFGIKNNRNAVFQKAEFYPLRKEVRSAQINALLKYIQAVSKPNAEKGEQDVVVFYYQGEEVLNPKNEIVLRTQDQVKDNSAFTGKKLKDHLNEMYGAHLVFLDVAQPDKLDKDWETGPFLGLLRSVHEGKLPKGDFPLISALRNALPQTKELNELPQALMQSFQGQGQQPSLDNRVPEDLKRIPLGEKP